MKSGRGVMARHFLSIIHLFSGDYHQMLEENDQIVKEAQQLQDWLLVYWGYGFRSWAEGRLGRHEEAMESMARSQTASQRLGGQIMGQDILEAVTAQHLLADVPDESALYRVEEALARAEATIELSREEVGGILGEGLAQRVCGQALARLERWEEAERHLAESWQILLSGENLLEAARTQVAWGLLCRDRGDLASARGHFEQAAAQFETSGLTREVESVWSYLAQMGQS